MIRKIVILIRKSKINSECVYNEKLQKPKNFQISVVSNKEFFAH